MNRRKLAYRFGFGAVALLIFGYPITLVTL